MTTATYVRREAVVNRRGKAMLATFVIGLREGLEAVLIVSIIAAFLKRNGIARWPMWLGVAAAVAISAGVGAALQAFEQSLPQARQEGMESVIGLVAVVFVTGMIVWTGKNARGLRAEIEGSATAAARKGTGWALAGMAFLAVVKEGFETAVFLLATLHASVSAGTAAAGAGAGIAISCVAGYLLYSGGARLNLAKLFKVSGVFLVFVAGGLLLTAFRTAHGAGWINLGQQRTVDLAWLSPIGSLRSALITGVLGIPADPRMIEGVAWLGYVIPLLAITCWPRRWRLAPARVPAVRLTLAAAAAAAAVALPLAVPSGRAGLPSAARLTPSGAATGAAPGAAQASVRISGDTATLEVRDARGTQHIAFLASARTAVTYQGVQADQWSSRASADATGRPATLTLDQLYTLFGRVPVGINSAQNPGPYHAAWSAGTVTTLWVAGGGILDAHRTGQATLTLSGGGLPTPRTLSLSEPGWSVAAPAVAASAAAITAGDLTAQDRQLWRAWFPAVLGTAAAALAAAAWRDRRNLTRTGTVPAAAREQQAA